MRAQDLDTLLADLTSGDDARAEAAVPALVALGETAFPALRRLLASEDADHRWWAVRVLSQHPSPPVEWIARALEDPSADVRQCAALGLCAHPSEENIPALIRALSDADSMVSDLAARALASIGEAAVPALLEVLEKAPQLARINAMRALSEIADPRAIPAMMKALDGDSLMMRHWAEEGLKRLKLDMVFLKPD
ncbi:MAG: HEAT repeat domain-containing protein [Anaerolineae bacterium]|nr:MAG: HEAT repeat domain-containing protein [Anaerolineae bacterium]